MFYLNYVGCKVASIGWNIAWWSGFTLTMWDVKTNLKHFLFHVELVLP